MKTLFLVRHAKSSWANEFIPDIDRPLNERGYVDAHIVSKHLFQNNFVADVLITSPAVRAMSTALIFSRNMKYSEDKIIIRKNLYETTVKDYVECIRSISDNYNSAMVFGHNNTMAEVVQFLLPSFKEEVKTCSVVSIKFTTDDWKKIPTGAILQFHLSPGQLKQNA